jgi:hypothetical protein
MLSAQVRGQQSGADYCSYCCIARYQTTSSLCKNCDLRCTFASKESHMESKRSPSHSAPAFARIGAWRVPTPDVVFLLMPVMQDEQTEGIKR